MEMMIESDGEQRPGQGPKRLACHGLLSGSYLAHHYPNLNHPYHSSKSIIPTQQDSLSMKPGLGGGGVLQGLGYKNKVAN